ncbi:MAG: hypothetical protein KY455_00425 [Euryarchaeota archaeon]|nr:hypothetical protein [Euryarchaeota archaeon]
MNQSVTILLGILLASPLVVLGLAVMGLTGDFDEAVPEWHSGDTWEYDATTTIRASGSLFGFGSADAGALVIDTANAMSVMNTTHHVSDIPVYAVAQSVQFKRASYGGNTFGVEGECVQQPDGTVSCEGDTPAGMIDEEFGGICAGPCGGGFLGFYSHEDLAFILPDGPEGKPLEIKNLDFPLTKGKTWNIVALGDPTGELDMDLSMELVAEAVEKEYLKLPELGPTETIRIEARLSDATEAAIETLMAKGAEHAGGTASFDIDVRLTSWYSPHYRNLVQTISETSMTTRFNVEGFTGSASMSMEMKDILVGHESAPKPERSLREAERLATLPVSAEGKNVKVAEEPWFFSVAADALSLDATAGEEVTLGLLDGWTDEDETSDGFAPPPAGSRVSWTHRYLEDGRPRIDKGQGDTITTTIDTPGLHVFTARVYDADGRLLGADDIVLEGYSVHEVAVSPIAGAAFSFTDTVPVLPGASYGVLRDTTDGPFLGRLFLADADGTTVAEKENGLASTHRLSDLSDFTPGDWTFGYEVDAQVGYAEARLEIHYLDGGGGWTMDDNLLPCTPPLCDLDAPTTDAKAMSGVRGLPSLGLLEALLSRL